MAGGTINSTVHGWTARARPLTGRVGISARRLRLKQLFPATPLMQKTLGELNGRYWP